MNFFSFKGIDYTYLWGSFFYFSMHTMLPSFDRFLWLTFYACPVGCGKCHWIQESPSLAAHGGWYILQLPSSEWRFIYWVWPCMWSLFLDTSFIDCPHFTFLSSWFLVVLLTFCYRSVLFAYKSLSWYLLPGEPKLRQRLLGRQVTTLR